MAKRRRLSAEFSRLDPARKLSLLPDDVLMWLHLAYEDGRTHAKLVPHTAGPLQDSFFADVIAEHNHTDASHLSNLSAAAFYCGVMDNLPTIDGIGKPPPRVQKRLVNMLRRHLVLGLFGTQTDDIKRVTAGHQTIGVTETRWRHECIYAMCVVRVANAAILMREASVYIPPVEINGAWMINLVVRFRGQSDHLCLEVTPNTISNGSHFQHPDSWQRNGFQHFRFRNGAKRFQSNFRGIWIPLVSVVDTRGRELWRRDMRERDRKRFRRAAGKLLRGELPQLAATKAA